MMVAFEDSHFDLLEPGLGEALLSKGYSMKS